MDLRGITELTSFGYSLGSRTPYANIRLLNAGEVVTFSDNNISSMQYWRWDQLSPTKQSENELLEKIYLNFTRAVKRRLRGDAKTIAFLSGGLDSRCVVTKLVDQNVDAHTFNFSRPGTQDKVLAAQYARKIGAKHTEYPLDTDFNPSMLMSTALRETKEFSSSSIGRPQLVWSGDGGSVGMGHVYLTRELVDLIRLNKLDTAINTFLKQQYIGLTKKLFKRPVALLLSGILERGIREELNDIHCEDPARSFHIFLMLNDQRRHLSAHFEDIDLHRIEFQLPFFDSDFLSAIIKSPTDLFLRHRFYTKWLTLFPPVITSVPWQTYPGHEPCPLPIPQELTWQWQPDYLSELSNKNKHTLLQHAEELLKANDFPNEIMSTYKLKIATWIYRKGLRDYSYVINIAKTYRQYWSICNGKFSLQ
jgi:hypothetical protein